jgi:hypothetical protein
MGGAVFVYGGYGLWLFNYQHLQIELQGRGIIRRVGHVGGFLTLVLGPVRTR